MECVSGPTWQTSLLQRSYLPLGRPEFGLSKTVKIETKILDFCGVTNNRTDRVVTEHHSKKTGEQNFDTRKRGVHRHGAFTSSSSRASACHHTFFTSRHAPLIQLVIVFSSASASPSCRISARHLASAIHHASTFHCAPLVRFAVTLPGALTPPSRCNFARCRHSSHPSCLVGLLHCPGP